MGSVKLETRNEGRGLREWDYVPLSEPRVVEQQIRNRAKCDEALYALQEESRYGANPILSYGVFPFSEPILCTYIDQDNLIAKAVQTEGERKIVGWLMEGYAPQDIGEHYGCGVKKVLVYLRRAVEKICEENNKNWMEVNCRSRCNIIEGRDVF